MAPWLHGGGDHRLLEVRRIKGRSRPNAPWYEALPRAHPTTRRPSRIRLACGLLGSTVGLLERGRERIEREVQDFRGRLSHFLCCRGSGQPTQAPERIGRPTGSGRITRGMDVNGDVSWTACARERKIPSGGAATTGNIASRLEQQLIIERSVVARIKIAMKSPVAYTLWDDNPVDLVTKSLKREDMKCVNMLGTVQGRGGTSSPSFA